MSSKALLTICETKKNIQIVGVAEYRGLSKQLEELIGLNLD